MELILNVESIVAPVTGIGRYASEILTGVLDRGMGERLHCFSQFGWVDARQVLDASMMPSGKKRVRLLVRALPYAYEMRSLARNTAFRWRAGRLKDAVYHEPNYILKPHDGPCIVNCHDLSHLRYPEHHPSERVRYLNRHLEQSLHRAERVIALSDFVRAEVLETYSLDPAKVVTIPLGVNAHFRPHTAEETREVLARHGLGQDGYVLSVATFEPRKNLDGLLKAFMQLPEATRRAHPLVLCGAAGWRDREMEQSFDVLVRQGMVRRLGYVPESDLPALYAGAAVFAFPSFYEGFGLPPLEAMASGAAVLASNTGSVLEVVGDAGLLVDPHDDAALAEGLQRLLDDRQLRDAYRATGLERARGFSWAACVDRTIALYREVQR